MLLFLSDRKNETIFNKKNRFCIFAAFQKQPQVAFLLSLNKSYMFAIPGSSAILKTDSVLSNILNGGGTKFWIFFKIFIFFKSLY